MKFILGGKTDRYKKQRESAFEIAYGSFNDTDNFGQEFENAYKTLYAFVVARLRPYIELDDSSLG